MLALMLYLQGEVVPNEWSVWIVLIQSLAAVFTAVGVPYVTYLLVKAQKQASRIETLANGNLAKAQSAEKALRVRLDDHGLDHSDI